MSSPKLFRHKSRVIVCVILLAAATSARATLPSWLQHVVGASNLEAALYRLMSLPSAQASYPRPPKEAQTELAKFPADTPDLYPIRARTDESALDFSAAEADWKLAVDHAKDPVAAKLDLANFYHRQLRIPQEIATLREVAAAPSPASERFTDPGQQRSWQASLRILSLIAEQDLPAADASATYEVFLTRYPAEPAVYARAFQFQLDQKNYPAAEALVPRYKQQFPQDQVFPIRAQALLELRRGNIDAALAVYDQSFQPLWSPDLIQSYFALLTQTHRQRVFVADARTALAAHPDGSEALNALARIFYYQQQQGHLDQAQQAIDAFRIARESRNGAWSATDLSTLATLSISIHNYAEAARYDYALASSPGNLPSGETAAQAGLASLINLLLTAPDQPIALGAGNLTLYRDIATLDQGPGYWNGILSLWLNGTSPQSEYNAETAKAQSYFHRSKAAELLTELDQKYPAAPERASLHAAMIRTYASYGESAAVIAAGKQYLAAFPAAFDRVETAGLVADSYERQKDTTSEFALYDAMLSELAARTAGQPLSAAARGARPPIPRPTPGSLVRVAEDDTEESIPAPTSVGFSLDSYTTSAPHNQAAVDYSQILDRYLARLVAAGHIPQALTVLRRQIDRSPDDPALYERLAEFLGQNNLAQAEEETYKQALAHFRDNSWYDKLARFYIRHKNSSASNALTRQVTGVFSGTELDQYFQQVEAASTSLVGPQLNLQLNLYAAKRFPHDLIFVHNLLGLYQSRATRDPVAYEALLRRHWFDEPTLRDQFFAYLSRTGKLEAELKALSTPSDSNPAATRELAEADVWTSQFESATPLLGSVAALYPADDDLGDRAVSLYRSLSYLDPTKSSLTHAVAIETNLLAAAPDSPDRLATLGDLYAEATSTGGEDLASASPYWVRIPTLHPGTPAGYLTSATIFWDYFQFDRALAELTSARTRFHQPALYGYEAGAIQENRRDMAAAVAEYTASAIQTPELATEFNSFVAVAQAYFKPPSDAADSNFRSTAQSFFNSDNSRARLLQLANRASTKALVDQASLAALNSQLTAHNSQLSSALTLRADILTTQHRQPELAPLFTNALTHANTADEAAAIGALAQTHTLTPVYEAALTKQAVLTTDPVEKIQLEYTLARSLESRKQLPAATRVIDTVYRANPRILGVVRATTDFYVRNHEPRPAITTLLEASRAATPTLARNFALEAAQHANDSGDTAQARSLALTLLPATPYDATVLAVIAASYAKGNDNSGLKAFYLAQLDHARTDPALTAGDRKQGIALLRRGLIPALTSLHDYEGATNQYIALLSAYPEDSATAQEAALYALRNQRQAQLVDFLQTTVKQSPKDSRFAILLAQVDTNFEDLPAAVTAYNAAIAIRKDRADLYQARVDLNLRLGLTDPARLELAAADFNRLYLLTYKDPQWMVRLAELRARQNRPTDAVKALTAAYIENRPRKPENYFTVAAQLEKWNLLNEARAFAQQGLALAGNNLLISPDSSTGANTYARILTRLGKPDEALATLTRIRKASDAAITFPANRAAELADSGVSAKDIAAQRNEYIKQRQQMAETQLSQALNTIGSVVSEYYTPEQKLAYANTLDALHTTNPTLALTAATSAGLADREAAWRKQQLLTGPPNADFPPYIELQQRRLAYPELAQTLEAYAARVRPQSRNGILQQAADAWRNAGDDANELRVLRSFTSSGDRLHELLLRRDRPALDVLAASHEDAIADSAVNYLIAHSDLDQSASAIRARGRMLSPLWTDSAYSLAGLYFDPANPPVRAAFAKILRANSPISERIAHPSDPKTVVTGELYFYYAAHFGNALGNASDSEDFLPADLERSPSDPSVYVDLARTYDKASNPAAAIAEYRHALELAPKSITISDALAELLYRSGHKDEALTQWRNAFAILHHDVETNAFPAEFYTGFESILRHLGETKLTAAFHPEIEAVVRPYFAKNGTYRSNEFLEVIYTASATPAEGAAFILSLSTAAPEPVAILEDLRRASWITPESRETVLLRQIDLERNRKPDTSDGSPAGLIGYQSDLIDLYLNQNQLEKAQRVLDSIVPDNVHNSLAFYQTVLATRTGQLQALLDKWRANPEAAADDTVLSSALYYLRKPTTEYKPDPARIRPLQEYVFAGKQLADTLQPTDFLALAESRIDTNDLPGAIDLLRRLTLRPPSSVENGKLDFPGPNAQRGTLAGDPSMVGQPATIAWAGESADANPYINTDYAATLLETTHHPAEAIPFLTTLVQSVPWNSSYRLRLAHAQRDAGHNDLAVTLLRKVAADPQSPYLDRVTAARDLRTLAPNSPALGSAELNYLAASPDAPPQSASSIEAGLQPYFVEARIGAADSTTLSKPDREALLREAIAIAPNSPPAGQARLSLLQLADDSTNPAAILALIDATHTSANDAAESDTSGEDNRMTAAEPEIPAATLPALNNSLDLPAQIHLALLIANAFQRDAEPAQALPYLQLAVVLDRQSPHPDPQLTRRRDDLHAAIHLDQINAARRPVFTKDLAQPADVRPKLTQAALAKQEAP